MRKTLFIVCAALCIHSCKPKDKRIYDRENNITSLPPDDARFLALKDTAQQHIPELITSFEKNKRDSNFNFIIKSDYIDGTEHEHMWSAIVDIKGDLFTCVFTDSAYTLKNIVYGDTVFIKKSDIEDWTIFDTKNDITTGSFSAKYLNGEE